jgi:mannose-6-phosphate isomerase-like protein (cupin superfamily)
MFVNPYCSPPFPEWRKSRLEQYSKALPKEPPYTAGPPFRVAGSLPSLSANCSRGATRRGQREGRMVDAAERARRQIVPAPLPLDNEMHFSSAHPEFRAWNLTPQKIQQDGALFSFYSGAAFSGLGGEMRLILWPGYGITKTGFHSAFAVGPQDSNAHRHPISDEVLISFINRGQLYCDDRWLVVGPNESVMAPCGVTHGAIASPDLPDPYWGVGGFAAPPQQDVYLLVDGLFHDGVFATPEYATYPPPHQR